GFEGSIQPPRPHRKALKRHCPERPLKCRRFPRFAAVLQSCRGHHAARASTPRSPHGGRCASFGSAPETEPTCESKKVTQIIRPIGLLTHLQPARLSYILY